MIWDKILTTHDTEIAKKIKSIAHQLLNHFENSGKITLEWNGFFVDLSTHDWSFNRAFDAAIDFRASEIEDIFLKKGLFEKFSPDINDLESTAKAIFEFETANFREGKASSDFTPWTDKFTKRKKAKYAPAICDPLDLIYFYHLDSINSPNFISNSNTKAFLNYFYKEYDLETALEIATAQLRTNRELDVVTQFLEMTSDSSFPTEISKEIARYELYKAFYNSSNQEIFNVDASLRNFMSQFFKIHLDYIDEENPSYGITDLFSRDNPFNTRKATAVEYLKKSQSLIINGHAFASYKLGISLIHSKELKQYSTYGFSYHLQVKEHISIGEIFTYELLSMIMLKIEMFSNFHEDIFSNLKKEHKNAEYFTSKLQLLEYLKRYFADLKDQSNKLYYPTFHLIKFPPKINNEILECICSAIDNLIIREKGVTHTYFLTPSEYAEFEAALEIVSDMNEAMKVDKKQEMLPCFDKEKIPWPENQKNDLEICCYKLCNQRNRHGHPYMAKKDVDYFLRANFDCYAAPFIPRLLNFDGPTSTLRYFIYQLFNTMGRLYTDKLRFAQLLAQNFKPYSGTVNSIDDLKNLASNIRDNPPKKKEVILI